MTHTSLYVTSTSDVLPGRTAAPVGHRAANAAYPLGFTQSLWLPSGR
jgi:hypothetical protein